MGKKPSYEELEKRVWELEKEALERKQMEMYIGKLNRLKEQLLGPDNISIKLKYITDWVVKTFDADFARIWIVKKGDLCDSDCSHASVSEGPHVCHYRDQCLHLMASSGRYTHTDGSHKRVPFGCYKIGRVAAGDDPKFLTNDVISDHRVHDHEWARSLNLAAFAGYKLLSAEGKPIGVLALFSKQTISADEDALLESLANTAAQVIQSTVFEEALLESEKQKEMILNCLVEHVLHLDTEMRIIWANRAACESANLPYEEIVGRYCYEIWPQRSDVCPDCSVIKAMKTGQFQAIEKSTPDKRHWFVRGYPLLNRNGDIVGGIEVTLEITELKLAEEAIRESEHRYSALVLESPDAIISLAKTGTLLSFNPAAERISGLLEEEVIGKHFTKIGVLAKQSIPKALKEFALVITGVKRRPFELTILNKDKRYFFMEANPRLIKHKGEKAWIQVTFRDITDRKLAEVEKKKLETQLQQAHKMEAIGTLAGGIAHDFNNILGIIIGNTELALDDIPERERARFNLEEIRSAGLRAKDVVKQLLSFARKTELERKPIKLIPVIKDSIKLLRATIPVNIDIRQNMTESYDTIFADPTQIHQVIINLCTNASHAMQETGGILGIEVENVFLKEDSDVFHPELTPGSYIKLTVRDNGKGINPELKDRIFDPYFTTKEVGKGTGMGLSVVHGIVKNYGGAISVDSELGKGTKFNIYFPVIEKEAMLETKTVEELPTGNERILFVDDDESIIYVDRFRLERLGYQVETKTNPVEALELFRANPDQFDLVITDMAMPQMTGDQMMKEILKIRTDMPIILCTGFSEKIDEKKAKEIGAVEYVEKPLDKHDFAFKVRKVLDGKR